VSPGGRRGGTGADGRSGCVGLAVGEAEGKGERSGNWEAGGRVFMDGLGHGPRSLPVTGAGGGGGLVGGCRRARHTHTAHWRHRWWEVAETAAEARPPDGETDACVAWQLALAMPWHGMAWHGVARGT
jgi:hypothetical protein